jgi:Helix-turn-helix domain
MTTNINEIIANLPPERQAKIQARAAELIAEEATLQNLRQARELTKLKVAELLNFPQESITQLEDRADLLVSTLQEHIAAIGGELSLVVEFKDRPSIKMTSLKSFGDSTAS